MAKKQASFKTRGMNRDLSVSAFNPEFSFENVNLRLSTSESNTFMSWVNEKGTAVITLIGGEIEGQPVLWEEKNNENKECITAISGTPIGTAIINEYLVLFTHESSGNNPDHIYLLKYVDKDAPSMKGIELFNGNLEFSVEHPLETLVSYESSEVQKVYWVDGLNQPRCINVVRNTASYYKMGNTDYPINTIFDFVRELQLKEQVKITKTFNSSGEFPAGVIQYAFTYYNKYGQESNVFYVSPLYYISYQDRGGSPEDKINNVFKIKVNNPDTNFEYLRIYSILRTSLDATPVVKRVQDIKISNTANSSTSGSSINDYLNSLGIEQPGAHTVYPKSFSNIDISLTKTIPEEDDYVPLRSIEGNDRYELPHIGQLFEDTAIIPHTAGVYSNWDDLEPGDTVTIFPAPELPVSNEPITIDYTTYPQLFSLDEDNNIAYLSDENFEVNNATKIIVPSTITVNGDSYTVALGMSAFEAHTNLKEIELGGAIAEIGSWAFLGCSNLTTITVNNGGTMLVNTLPAGVDTMDYDLFSGCSSLTSFTIPDTVTTVNGGVFDLCNSLTEIVINGPATVGTIVKGLPALKKVTVGGSVTAIGDSAFKNCSSLTSLIVGDSVTSIYSTSLQDCTSLKEVVLGSGITTIPTNLFSSCDALTSLTIEGDITNLNGTQAKMTNLTYLSLNCATIGNWFMNGSVTYLQNLQTLNLGNGVVTVSPGAFFGCNNLTNVTLGDSIENLGTVDGDGVFEECTSLLYVTNLNSTPITLHDGTFPPDVSRTLYVNDATTVTAYENSSWHPIFSAIKAIESEDPDADLSIKIGDLYYSLSSSENIHTASVIAPNEVSEYSGDIVIPATIDYVGNTYTVTSIAERAFYDCDYVTSITIGENIESIEENAFRGCTGLVMVLTDLSVWYGITFANEYSNPLFIAHYLYDLEEEPVIDLVVPGGVALKNLAFYGCKSITSVDISSNLTSVGNSVFAECPNLKTVTINSAALASEERTADTDALDSIFGDQVETYIFGDAVTALSDYILSGCRGLKTVYFSDNLTSIGKCAFEYCTGLTAVILPESLTTIGSSAFYGCSNLVSVTAKMTSNIPDLYNAGSDRNVFTGISNSCKLYIPANTTQDYETAHWTSSIFKGGVIEPQDPRFAVGEKYYYIFTKADYQNLVFRIGDNYYSWGSESNNTATIYMYPPDTSLSDTPNPSGEWINSKATIICEQEKSGGVYERVKLRIVAKSDSSSSFEFMDTNTTGETVDPTYLLYLGGETVSAYTLEQKDNTLFLGNLEIKKSAVRSIIENSLLTNSNASHESPLIKNSISCITTERPFNLPVKHDTDTALSYMSTLSCPEDIEYQGIQAFKSGEYYRLGLQFQYKTGQWSEPCWIGDKQWELDSAVDGSWGPRADETGSSSSAFGANVGVLYLPEFKYTIEHDDDNADNDIQNILYNAGYRRMRAVYAVPIKNDRTILCQGVLSPAVFRQEDRDNSVYAQSSWLFRTKVNVEDTTKYNGYMDKNSTGGAVGYSDYLPTIFSNQSVVESQQDAGGAYEYQDGVWMSRFRSTEIMGSFDAERQYRIDHEFGTLNSPDIDLGYDMSDPDYSSFTLYQVGNAPLDVTCGDIDIQTKSSTMGSMGKGFIHKPITTTGTSALISGNYYEDTAVACYEVKDGVSKYRQLVLELKVKGDNVTFLDGDTTEYKPFLWPVYMWHRKGSLNNDVVRDGRSAELLKKVISNYRMSYGTQFYEQSAVYSSKQYSIKDMKLFNTEEASQIIKVDGNIYQGCVDTMVVPDYASDLYVTYRPKKWEKKTKDEYVLNSASGSDETFLSVPVLKFRQNDLYALESRSGVYFYNKYLKEIDIPLTNDFLLKNSWTARLVYRKDDEYWVSSLDKYVANLGYFKDPISIKYKSTPHIAVQLNSGNTTDFGDVPTGTLPVVEIRRPYDAATIFGGTSEEALEAATWIPCGPVVDIDTEHATDVYFKWGDTYFQRYECLKTYPYTFEDINQVVEIGSFLLETRINIDGRYDRNRAQSSNLNISPLNYNLINTVYSQKDNFFNYKMLPVDYYTNTNYSNQITWTKTKENGADVDLWTNVTLASILDMDGNLGHVNKLIRINDRIISFQDKGIAQVLYNENTQVSTTEGVPIEIANSGKVQGKRYISNTIGCSNKWSIVNTASGLYFMDSNDKSIYCLDDKLSNVSSAMGFDSWSKNNIPAASVKWTPENNFNNFVSYYDRLNQDILFINKDTALALSEKVRAFTSFYDYGNTPYFCNLEDTGVWIRSDNSLWRHQTGSYCRFFGANKPYSMTLVGNPEPQTDKIFTNLEFRASVAGEGRVNNDKFTPTLPFDSLEAWNEYQHGFTTLSIKSGHGASLHGGSDSALNRKFRIWRCDIPRDNWPLCPMPNPLGPNPTEAQEEAYNTAMKAYNDEKNKGITRYYSKPIDRMRNSWVYLKLKKAAAEDITQPATIVTLPKAEIHDMIMTYFN